MGGAGPVYTQPTAFPPSGPPNCLLEGIRFLARDKPLSSAKICAICGCRFNAPTIPARQAYRATRRDDLRRFGVNSPIAESDAGSPAPSSLVLQRTQRGDCGRRGCHGHENVIVVGRRHHVATDACLRERRRHRRSQPDRLQV